MAPPAYRGAGSVRTAAVIGTGLIGAGWVAMFLSRGIAVRVCDPAPGVEARVRAHVAGAWPQLLALGVAECADPQAVSFYSDPETAAQGVDFVQENAPEREDVKIELYRRLDSVLPPHVLIASSTSSFPVTALQSACVNPQRCVLGHPFNPVHLIPLVEVGGGESTDPVAIETTTAFYRHLGKRPIRLEREVFGHIANRLASAMFREAVHLVDEGITTVQGVDDALRFGPALKWAIQGQFMTYYTSGGEGGMENFLRSFGPGQERRWAQLGAPRLCPELNTRIVAQANDLVGSRSPAEFAAAQDAMLLELLRLLHDTQRHTEVGPPTEI